MIILINTPITNSNFVSGLLWLSVVKSKQLQFSHFITAVTTMNADEPCDADRRAVTLLQTANHSVARALLGCSQLLGLR